MRYDLFSPEFKANPFPTYARMRQTAPVYAHQTPKGDTIWYITRYDDVLAVLDDTDRFVKDIRRVDSSAGAALTPNIHRSINQNMLFSDPPDHTRLRALVNLAFTTRRVGEMAFRVQAIAESLLDRVRAQGEMDLIEAYALPLPVAVISELLGIPPRDRHEIFDWSQAIISPGRSHLNFKVRRNKVRSFVDYLRQMIVDRRHKPGNDLTTALVQAEEAGDKLSETEVSSMIALLLVTGHETTVNLIGNGVLALLQHPDQMALVRDDPEAMDTAIEELLRYDGPVETSTTRWARVDMVLGDQMIRRGDVVRVVLASANRDPTYFTTPERLEVERRNNRHLAFGHGIHYCLGAPLARLEGRIALESLFRRLPDLRLKVPVDQLEWRSGVLFRGLARLPVTWR